MTTEQRRVVLITGASSGFGEQTAQLLSADGKYKVYGTSRKPAQSSDRKTTYTMLTLDVDSDSSTKDCVSFLLEKEKRIDVLINCAGSAMTGGAEETSIEEIKSHFETNFFGTVRMVDQVLPSMRRQKNGRIVNLGSIASEFPVPFEGFYAAGKAALYAYTEALRHEVRQFQIKVSIIQPGFFRTNLGNSRTKSRHAIDDYREARERAVHKLEEYFQQGGDPLVVAKTIKKVIESDSPNLRYLVGSEKRYVTLKKILPSSMLENQLRKRWRLDG